MTARELQGQLDATSSRKRWSMCHDWGTSHPVCLRTRTLLVVHPSAEVKLFPYLLTPESYSLIQRFFQQLLNTDLLELIKMNMHRLVHCVIG
jgi:hypothetical protein